MTEHYDPTALPRTNNLELVLLSEAANPEDYRDIWGEILDNEGFEKLETKLTGGTGDLDVASVSTEDALSSALTIVENDLRTLRIRGIEGLDGGGGGGGGVRGEEAVVEPHPDRGAHARLLFKDQSDGGHETFIGRYHPAKGTSHEVLKFNSTPDGSAGNIALESEIDGFRLLLQESATTTPTQGLLQLITSDSSGVKTTRFDVSGGEDLADIRIGPAGTVNTIVLDPFDSGSGNRDTSPALDFRSFTGPNFKQWNDDGTLILENSKGQQVQYQGNGQFSLQNAGSFRGPPEYNNAVASDLQNYEWAIDTNRGGTGTTSLLYRDSSGTVHYFDADGTL